MEKLQQFVAGGGLVVAAAGNRHDGEDLKPVWPAAWAFALAVAGGPADEADELLGDEKRYYDWSNGGAWVDVATPLDNHGWMMTSAHNRSGGLFVFTQGTSALATMVSAQLASGSVRNAH